MLPHCWDLLYAVSGVLKGYDQLLNLVLDEAVEYLRGEEGTLGYHSLASSK